MGISTLCVAVDMGSRWIVTKPMKTMEAHGTAEFLFEEIVCRYGMFRKLVSDRGSNFMSETFQAFLKILQIKHLPTVAWMPATNALVERSNREFGRRIANFISGHQDDWDNHLPEITMALNITRHRTMGTEPYFLMYASKPRYPLDIILPDLVKEKCPGLAQRIENLTEALERARMGKIEVFHQNKHEHDKKLVPITYEPGDKVYLKKHSLERGKNKKLQDKWLPGWEIVRRDKDSNKYLIQHETNKIKGKPEQHMVDQQRLKHFFQRDNADMPILAELLDLNPPLEENPSPEPIPPEQVLSPPELVDPTDGDNESPASEPIIEPQPVYQQTRTRKKIGRPPRYLCRTTGHRPKTRK